MEKVFLSVLNMSLTGAFVIVAIMLVRLPLKKAPKIISYALWAVAGFRLVFPFSIQSMFSLLPFKAAPIPQDIAMQAVPRINSGVTAIDNAVSVVLPAASPAASVNPLQIWLGVGTYIWLFGIAVMLIYSLVSIVLLKCRLQSAIHNKGNLYEADNLKTPFVIGLFSPKIYIPAGLSDEERRYIVLHEQIHIRRHDHVVKMFSYLVLCLHWFNPLVWIAFILMGADMEMSCDERVIKELGGDIKIDYSLSLVRVAAGHKILNGSPLAFGEGGMKGRVKNVLNFKKPAAWVVIVAVVFITVFSIGLATNQANSSIPVSSPQISHGQNLGVDMVQLDYASDHTVIFHDYFGLFVYDLDAQKIVRSMDLKSIGCSMTQGDDACEVLISADGNTVQLRPMSSKKMYVYSVSENTLKELDYAKMEDRFANFVDITEAVGAEKAGSHSYYAVRFGSNEYGFLQTTDWTVDTLTYIRNDKAYQLFDLKHESQALPVENTPIPGLSSEIPSDRLYLFGYFTEDSLNPFYYVPEEEIKNELAALIDGLKMTSIDSVGQLAGKRMGYSLMCDGVWWEIWSNGVLTSNVKFENGEQIRSDKFTYADAPKIFEGIQTLMRNKLGIVPFEPRLINGIVSAKLDAQFMRTDKKYTQMITDAKALSDIEEMLSNAVNTDAGCPFNEAYLTLTLANGNEILLAIASDSCPTFFVNGQGFDYKPAKLRGKEDSGYSNEMLYKYFDQIPMATRGK